MRFPLLAAMLSVVLILACDLFIFFDIRRYAVRRRSLYSWLFAVFALLGWGLIIAILCYPKADPETPLKPLMWLLFWAMAIYVPKFIYCICSLVGRVFTHPVFSLRKGKKIRRHNHGVPVGCLLAGFVCVVILWGAFITAGQINVNHVAIASKKLPAEFDGFKILQFSDAHLGTWGSDTTFISRVVDSINAQKPDLILFTGDLVSRRSSELDPFVKVLRRLYAPHGVYSVHGNHDYASYVVWPDSNQGKRANRDVGRLDSLETSMGWKVLNNATAVVKIGNDSIVVIGVENWGEPPFTQLGKLGVSYPDSEEGTRGLNDDNFKILLTHNPNHWNQVVTKVSNIDLSLAGHTHAMQMMVGSGKNAWSPSALRYDQWGGLYTKEAKDGTPMNLYVNIGIGEVGYPARMGSAKPELTLFTLKSEQ